MNPSQVFFGDSFISFLCPKHIPAQQLVLRRTITDGQQHLSQHRHKTYQCTGPRASLQAAPLHNTCSWYSFAARPHDPSHAPELACTIQHWFSVPDRGSQNQCWIVHASSGATALHLPHRHVEGTRHILLLHRIHKVGGASSRQGLLPTVPLSSVLELTACCAPEGLPCRPQASTLKPACLFTLAARILVHF